MEHVWRKRQKHDLLPQTYRATAIGGHKIKRAHPDCGIASYLEKGKLQSR